MKGDIMVTEEKKKHKLLFVAPSGREYEIGFLSPCRDGIVLGTAKVEDVDTSHLTVIVKGETLSSHITPQDRLENKRYFHSMNKKQIVKKFQKLVEDKLVYTLPDEKKSQEAMYVTQKFEKWFNAITAILYQEKVTPKEIVHILNFKKLLEKLPRLIEEIAKAPSTFFGLCKADEILEDESKIAGITNSRLLLLPFEDQLWCVNLQLLTNFSFNPTLEKEELTSPLNGIYRSMGIPQYLEEVEKKKFLEKLLSNET